MKLVTSPDPLRTLDAEIHKRITEAGLWGDPRWQHITDWNNHAYAKDKP